jgi:hypothetical protein
LSPRQRHPVVVDAKPDIVTCVKEQNRVAPKLTGKLVLHWSVETDGTTSGVGVALASAAFKGTHFAMCLTKLAENWQFPKHQVKHAPIDFPFPSLTM